MVNIDDVAKHLGVSRSTVSYALSGKRPISAETKARVHAAVRELDFHPSATARALAESTTKIIALLAPMADNATPEVALQFVHGVAQACREFGYDVLLVTGVEAFDSVQRLIRGRQVDGFIVLDVEESDPRTRALQKAKAPATLVGMPRDVLDLDRVDVDWALAGSELVTELADLGHRTICLLGVPESAHKLGMTYATCFRDGARDAAEKAKVNLIEIFAGDDFFEIVRDIDSVIAENPEITAFVVQHEAAVAPLFSALNAVGAKVPYDYSVLGVTLDNLGVNFAPHVSGLINSSADTTREAVTLLVDRLQNPGQEPRSVLLNPAYQDHGTAGSPRQVLVGPPEDREIPEQEISTASLSSSNNERLAKKI